MAETTKYQDMTPEQQQVAFEKWMAQDENKKLNNQAKRGALVLLKKAHEKQYDGFVESDTKRLKAAA